METENNLLDILSDPNNKEDIVLMADDGTKFVFKQIAVIPYEGKLYCVLKPASEIKGIADDEALVFRVDIEADGTPTLKMEESDEMALTIFKKYQDMLA